MKLGKSANLIDFRFLYVSSEISYGAPREKILWVK